MISIFARYVYTEEDPRHQTGVYLRRVSSRVRGEEIAGYLGARYNPTEGFERDVRVYVKPRGLRQVKAGAWVDVLDDRRQIDWLKERPDLGVIAMSLAHREHLLGELPGHRVKLIPHHHLNFERARRVPGTPKVVGFVGSFSLHSRRLQAQVGADLAAVGVEYRPLLNYTRREDILAYYQTIDVQVVPHFGVGDESNPWSHPTRLLNAASFGIPTVAPRLPGYREIEGGYIPVRDYQEMIEAVVRLQAPEAYDSWPERLVALAEPYHVEHIAELYRSLE